MVNKKFKRVVGDVYISETLQQSGRIARKYHIGHPGARPTFVESASGSVITHLINNIGKKFSLEELAQVSGMKEDSLKDFIIYGKLRYDFSHSKCFDLVRLDCPLRYGLEEIEPPEGYLDEIARRDV